MTKKQFGQTMHLGLIGYGSIATSLIEMLTKSRVAKLTILVRPETLAQAHVEAAKSSAGATIKLVTNLSDMIDADPNLVVECAGHAAVSEYVPKLLDAGRDVIVASVGALANEALYKQIMAAAARNDSRLILPSGAIGGLDILQAISQVSEVDVRYRGIKPAIAWKDTPAEKVVDLTTLNGAKTFYSGTGREAALLFPKNANVVAALALAGGGFDRMRVELVADPNAQSNQHTYTVNSPMCRYSMAIEAKPTQGNARTSATTVASILTEIDDYQIVA